MSTVAYARVSKAAAGGRTTSVDDQLAELHEAAQRHGLTIGETYADRGISASGRARRRPEWDRLLDDIEGGHITVIALWEVSRASRRLAEWAAFRDLCLRHGIKWLTPNGLVDPGQDRVGTGVTAVMAEQASEETSARIRRTVRQRAAEGRPHGKEVYGLRRVYSSSTGALETVEIEPTEARVVQEVFERFAAGEGSRTIARSLNERGVLCPSAAVAARRGKPIEKPRQWNGRQVTDLLRRRAYLGVRVHVVGDRLDPYKPVSMAEHTAVWPPLVEREVFDRVQVILADPGRWTRPDDGLPTSVRHYLSGVLRCGKCSGPMRVTSPTYYSCNDSTCRGATVNREGVEELVGQVVVERLGRPDAAAVWEGGNDAREAVQEARAAIEEAQERIDGLVPLYTAGRLSAASFAAAEADLLAQIEEAKKVIAKASAPGLPDWASEGVVDIEKAWGSWSAGQRAEVARALFDGIDIQPIGRSGRPRKGAPIVPLDRLTIRWR